MKRKTTEEFIIDAYCKHSDRYNYKLVHYKGAKTKVKIICLVHGVFEQVPSYHLQGQGCPKCAGNAKSYTQEFIKKAQEIHGDIYNYKLVHYKGAKTKVKIICHIHGTFKQVPSYHLQGKGCPKCAGNAKSYTQEFIKKAQEIHGDTYNYKLVNYKNNRTKVKIICPVHGTFKQVPSSHLKGCGCPKCAGNVKNSTQEFIEKAQGIHGDKYNYSLIQYKNNRTKIKIICHKHGVFEQRAGNHINLKHGCPKCNNEYKGIIYAKNNIPLYDTYAKQLSPYGVSCKRNKEDENVLEVKCMYCDRWYIPTLRSVYHKIKCINGKQSGESNLYCSIECKQTCPTYRQRIYPKGFKDDRTNTSREVQPALRKCVLKRDNYTCQKCGATDTELHCHHYEGIEVNPIESADADNCITLCKACHNNIHKADKCDIKQYQRKKCKEGVEILKMLDEK